MRLLNGFSSLRLHPETFFCLLSRKKHRPRVRVRTATGVDCDPETDSPAFVSIPKHFSASYPEIRRPRVRVRSAAGVDCDCETDSPAYVSIPKHFSTFYPVNTSS